MSDPQPPSDASWTPSAIPSAGNRAGNPSHPATPVAGYPPIPPAPPLPPAPASYGQAPAAPAYGSAPQTTSAPGYPPASPYVAPTYPQYGAFLAAPTRRVDRSALGVVALVPALVATVVAPVLGAVFAHPIGIQLGKALAMDPDFRPTDLSVLSPVRDIVLFAEIGFWAGTALGIWALVQGIIAIATRRGRGAGIAAVVIAALGPVLYGVAVLVGYTTGIAAGSSIGG